MEQSFTSVVQDKVEQLRVELQQDIKAIQRTLQGSLDHVTTNLQQCETQIHKCCTRVGELQNDFQEFIAEKAEAQTEKTTQISSAHPIETVSPLLPMPLAKSDHIK